MTQGKLASIRKDAGSDNEVSEPHIDAQWDCLYGLPSRCYLDFVGRFILQTDHRGNLDPFSIDLSADHADCAYVSREQVTDDIRGPGTRLILGRQGIGKTAIFDRLLHQADEFILSVGLRLQHVPIGSLNSEILVGKTSFLTPTLLIPYVFETYWEKTILSPHQSAKYLPQVRADKQWMQLLRWFYQHHPPSRLEVDDYELMAWLCVPSQVGPLQIELSPVKTLRELVRLVTWRVPPQLVLGSRGFLRAYREVEVLLDGTEQLSPAAIRRLVADAQSLYEMRLDRFRFKLFIDSAWEHQVVNIDCVRQGRVNVISLPDWSDSELRELLRRRIYCFRPGGSTINLESMPEYDLGTLLVQSGSLKDEAGDRLESLIIAGAQGIPLHALRLARCVVAACAGCWPREFPPPLSTDDIERLVHKYHEKVDISATSSGTVQIVHRRED